MYFACTFRSYQLVSNGGLEIVDLRVHVLHIVTCLITICDRQTFGAEFSIEL